MQLKSMEFLICFLAILLVVSGCNGDNGGEDDADAADGPDAAETGDTVDDKTPDADAPDVMEEDAAEDPVTEETAGDDAVEEDAGEEEEIEPAPQLAFTTNAAYDYSSGSYSVVTLDDMTVAQDVMSINSDAVVKCAGGIPMVLERFGADTVTILDIESPYSVESQFTVETGSNPVDIALRAAGDGVVTRNNVTTAAIIDLGDGELDTESLDLEGFADADGIPEMSAVAVTGGKIFIALQLLDRETAFWDPTGPGLVVVFDEETLDLIDVDPETADVDDAIALTAANPQPGFQASPAGDNVLYVAEVGFYGVLDGGIEGFNVSTYEAGGFIVSEETLGGDIAAWVVVDAGTGYAAVNLPGFAGDRLVRFDPSDGTVTDEPVFESAAYTLTAMALTSDHRLLVADRDLEGSGIVVFAADTGEQIGDSPIATGVAPFSICVL
ncbi:MAG: hypothetical protein ABIJ56_16025 [Pseudomonadota bacterium]